MSPEEYGGLSRPPRGNGVNVHLKDRVVFVQANYREVQSAWIDTRRKVARERGDVMTFTGGNGKRVTFAPEDVVKLEEL